jgi:hypothetical protein
MRKNMRNNRIISTFRGTGIAKERLVYPEKWKPRRRYCTRQRKFAGFVISKVGNRQFVAHSGLIVHPI